MCYNQTGDISTLDGTSLKLIGKFTNLGSIDMKANAHKMEYMCFNQTGDISTLSGRSLKLVDKFTYVGTVSDQPKKTSTCG